jgi:hypothetical protein
MDATIAALILHFAGEPMKILVEAIIAGFLVG